jgi:hypothetical protein
MATPSQIVANRLNALRSTGPTSQDGKAAVRFNALKTGIDAKSSVIPGEDAAELEQLAAGYHARYQPSTPEARFFVDALVMSEWQLRRMRKVEASLWNTFLGPGAELGPAYQENQRLLARVHRRIESLDRSFYRALRELQRMEAEAARAEDPQLDDLEPLPTELASLLQISKTLPPAAPELASPPAARRFDNPALRL